jgi:hypothetical protein
MLVRVDFAVAGFKAGFKSLPITRLVTVDKTRIESTARNKLKLSRPDGSLSLAMLRVIQSAYAVHAKTAQHNGHSIRLPSRIDCNSLYRYPKG